MLWRACCGSTVGTGRPTWWSSRCSWRPRTMARAHCRRWLANRSAVPRSSRRTSARASCLDHPGGAVVATVDRRPRHRRSYFVTGIVGTMTYHVARPWRWFYLGALTCRVTRNCAGGQGQLHQIGHLCALALGLACYPLVTGPIRVRSGILPRLVRRLGTHRRTHPLRRLRTVAISDDDLAHLRRCVELARRHYEAGDEPFGSLLLDAQRRRPVRGPQPVSRTATPPSIPSSPSRAGRRRIWPRSTRSRHGVHLRRALPDVRSRARLGRAGPHRVRHVIRAADRVATEWGARRRPSRRCRSRRSRPDPRRRARARTRRMR